MKRNPLGQYSVRRFLREVWQKKPLVLRAIAPQLQTTTYGAGLGLLLVTGCKTRAQAQVLPTVVILIMSAIGGSMVPRFFMPQWLQQLGWLTPNTWALEAYSGVFWRSESALQLLPLCCGLFGIGMAALGLSHWFGRHLVAANSS
jgi:ABC-2 type transport system permease protein